MSRLLFKSPVLFIIAGYPGSGRTLYAKKLSRQLKIPHIEDKTIRKELFEKISYSKDENAILHNLHKQYAGEIIAADKSVIIDGSSDSEASRKDLIEFALLSEAEPIIVWLQIDKEEAKRRYVSSDSSNTKTSFNKLEKDFELPSEGEKPLVLSGNHSFRSQLKATLNYLQKYELIAIQKKETATKKKTTTNKVESKPKPSVKKQKDQKKRRQTNRVLR